MRNRLDLRSFYLVAFLVIAAALGVLLCSALSNAQYMLTENASCQAQCILPAHGSAVCIDSCVGVPAGHSCTCYCDADNQGGGQCSAGCDYGTTDVSYCNNQ
jgi:hypothetical protein